MRFYVSQKEMARVAAIAANVTPKKTTRPILSHVLLQCVAQNGGKPEVLRVTANDEEITYQTHIDVDGEVEGEITVPAKDFASITSAMPNEPLMLEWLLNTPAAEVEITSAKRRCEFSLPTLPAQDFPDTDHPSDVPFFLYRAADLLRLLDHVAYAASSDEVRYYLCGVHVEIANGKPLRFVATDGHRLSLVEGDIVEGYNADLPNTFTIPRRVLTEIRRAFDPKGGPIGFYPTDKRIFFEQGRQCFSSLLIEGAFPDYRQVIPQKPTFSLRVSKTDLLQSLRRISLMSPESTMGLIFQVTGGDFVVYSRSSGRGQAKEQIKVHEGEGEVEIGFNAQYFIDSLSSLSSAHEFVNLRFTGPLMPCLVEPVVIEKEQADKQAAKSASFVIMPMRV